MNRVSFTGTRIDVREAAQIRAQLALRKNKETGHWEVYTMVHGSHVFRWYVVSVETKNWYLRMFPAIKTLD